MINLIFLIQSSIITIRKIFFAQLRALLLIKNTRNGTIDTKTYLFTQHLFQVN